VLQERKGKRAEMGRRIGSGAALFLEFDSRYLNAN
jgi:hypothetical protein